MKKTSVLILMVALAFCQKPPEKEEMYIKARSGLALRGGPGVDQPVKTMIPYGDKVTVLEKGIEAHVASGENGYWHKILYNGVTGYAFSAFLSEARPAPADKPAQQNDRDVSQVVGSWYDCMHFSKRGRDDHYVYGYRYTFHSDGTFKRNFMVGVPPFTGQYKERKSQVQLDGQLSASQMGSAAPHSEILRIENGQLCATDRCYCRE